MNCLQRALHEWDKEKSGVIMYDSDHAQFFRREPMVIDECGRKHLLSSFASSLNENDKRILKEYFERNGS